MVIDFKKLICSKIYFNINYDTKNSILLAGTGRSGTTWISNILNYDNEYRDIFEPFSNIYTMECHHFAYKQYLRGNDSREYFLNTARNVFSGRIRNKWIDQYNRRLFCKKRLIKEIRANLFLKWIKNYFPEIPIVFIIRHPLAVAHSRLSLEWNSQLEDILSQDELVEDFFQDQIDDIEACESEFERQIYLWCIENYVPLCTLTKNDAYVVCYEQFCLQPEIEARKLLDWIGKQYDPHDPRIEAALRQPSQVSSKYSAIITGDDLLGKWQKAISIEQRRKAVQILSLFSLDEFYNEDPLPVKVFEFSSITS